MGEAQAGPVVASPAGVVAGMSRDDVRQQAALIALRVFMSEPVADRVIVGTAGETYTPARRAVAVADEFMAELEMTDQARAERIAREFGAYAGGAPCP